jgi:peroxiredoxin Q/BCP
MPELKIGDKAPATTLYLDDGESRKIAELKGQAVILYFYPKDDTPGCTTEACGFNETLAAFKKLNAVVIGVSKDSAASHEKFKKKYNLKFALATDTDGSLCEAFGTWVEKSMYGRKYMGIDRATFLIDADGKIAALWRKVKVPGHVDEVKRALEAL